MTKHSEAVAAKSWLITARWQRKVGDVLATDDGGWHPQGGREEGASRGQRELYLEAF